MDTNFIKNLIAQAKESWVIMENGGKEIKISFPKEFNPEDKQARQLFIAELFQKMFNHKLKITNFSFKLKNKEGSEFIFDLNGSDTRLSCAAKNGTLSLYLRPEEVVRLQKLSGQSDNRAHRVAIFAFDPQNLKDLNYIIFYTDSLVSCTIETT